MVKKIAVLMATILLPLSITGCNSGIKFNIAYDARGVFGYKETNGSVPFSMLELVDSTQELKELCTEWSNPAFNENSEYYSNEFYQKIRSYDETYFDDKILIIYSFDRGHRRETKISSITVDGELLTVNARYNNKMGTFTDEAFTWLILLETNKANIADATTVQIVHK